MKPRKSKEIRQTLEKKGFVQSTSHNSHYFYYLFIDGKKYSISTFVSHGTKSYDDFLMGQIKKQLKFDSISDCENFFDCTMSGLDYVTMLRKSNHIS